VEPRITCGQSPSLSDGRACYRILPGKRALLLAADNAAPSPGLCYAVVSKPFDTLARFRAEEKAIRRRRPGVPKTDGFDLGPSNECDPHHDGCDH